MDSRTAATVLGVNPGASKREICLAFRTRAKIVHPDASGSGEAFITLRSAFDELFPTAPDRGGRDSSDVDHVVGPHHVGPGAWFRPAPRATINLTDSPTIRRATSIGVASATSAASPDRRDRSGRTFADHLAAQLSRH